VNTSRLLEGWPSESTTDTRADLNVGSVELPATFPYRTPTFARLGTYALGRMIFNRFGGKINCQRAILGFPSRGDERTPSAACF
jgi:hypothetical protein